jgi:hypothetical protein
MHQYSVSDLRGNWPLLFWGMIYMQPNASHREITGARRSPKLESLSALIKAIDYGTGAAT